MKQDLKTKLTAWTVAAILGAILAFFTTTAPPNLSRAWDGFRQIFQGSWAYPSHTMMALLAAGVLWFAAAGLGQLVLAKGAPGWSPAATWARWVLGTLTGWIILSLATLALGLAGMCGRLPLCGLVVGASAAAVHGWRIFWKDLSARAALPRAAREFSVSPAVGVLALALYLITIPYAATPAVESDELRYHLAAPSTWLALGRIQYLPHQAFSNFPFLVEMLQMLAMALQGTEAARLVHLSFLDSSAALTALIAYTLVRAISPKAPKTAANELAGIAGLAFAAIPTASLVACWAFVDLALTAYFLAVVYLGLLFFTSRNRPPAWIVGLMAAGCLGTKYSMLPLAGAVFGLWMALALIGRRSGLGRYAFTALGVAALAGAPWYLRNLIWTGNPLYPLAYSHFGGADWSAENAAFYLSKAGEKGFPMERLYESLGRHDIDAAFLLGPLRRPLEFLISPFTSVMFPEHFESHYLGPISWIALTLALILPFTRSQARKRGIAPLAWVVLVLLGSWLFWFITYQSNRFLLPGLALLLAVGAAGAARLVAARACMIMIRSFVIAGIAFSIIFSACLILGSPRIGHPLGVAFGFEPREDYLDRMIHYYRASQWLGPKLSANDRAILIGEHRTQYFPPWVSASDWFDDPQPMQWLRESSDNDALFALWHKAGIKYLLLNRDELDQYAKRYYFPRFTPEQRLRLDSLLGMESGAAPDARLKEVWRDTRYKISVYSIAD